MSANVEGSLDERRIVRREFMGIDRSLMTNSYCLEIFVILSLACQVVLPYTDILLYANDLIVKINNGTIVYHGRSLAH